MKCGEKYMYGSGNICVVCAEDRNGIGEHVLQLVTKARTLSNCGGGEVVAVCVAGIAMETSLVHVSAPEPGMEVSLTL